VSWARNDPQSRRKTPNNKILKHRAPAPSDDELASPAEQLCLLSTSRAIFAAECSDVFFSVAASPSKRRASNLPAGKVMLTDAVHSLAPPPSRLEEYATVDPLKF
jgi:hypothetical protein